MMTITKTMSPGHFLFNIVLLIAINRLLVVHSLAWTCFFSTVHMPLIAFKSGLWEVQTLGITVLLGPHCAPKTQSFR